MPNFLWGGDNSLLHFFKGVKMKLFKKVVILFSVFLIFNLSISSAYNKTDAAVVSKVASTAAKKVAQEVIKDQAVKMSFNMVMNYKYTPKAGENVQKPKASFEMICLPENRKPDKTCSKPMQVKKNLTSSDKKQVATKAGQLLDNKMGHKGWKKFLDWFVPLWIAGLLITTVDILLDGDMSSFFADLGYQALIDLGFITTIEKTPPSSPIETPSDLPSHSYDDEFIDDGYSTFGHIIGELYPEKFNLPYGMTYHSARKVMTGGYAYYYINFSVLPVVYQTKMYYHPEFSTLFNSNSLTIAIQGQGEKSFRANKIRVFTSRGINSEYDNVRGPLGKEYNFRDLILLPSTFNNGLFNPSSEFINDALWLVQEFFDELKVEPLQPMPEARPHGLPITAPNTTIKIPSPSSVPIKDKNTGVIVKPSPESTPDDITFIDKDGNPVDEDDLIVDDVEIENTPDGDIVKDPSGDPNVEEGIIPNPEDDIPNGDDPNSPPKNEDENPFVCDAELKMPRFNVLGKDLSTTFPFNVPFDLFRSFNNLFVNMGDKKPSFDWEIKAFDTKTEINITIPDFFDDWMPFFRGIMLFSFDVALLWAIYHFVRK